MQPDRIHINTVVRPPAESWAAPLNLEEMKKIQAFFGEKASIISEFDRHPLSLPEINVKEEIFRILKRRPLSLVDLSQRMAIPKKELEATMQPMVEEGKIKTRRFGNSVYYEVPKTRRDLYKGV
jgi:wyosine [tRNA(Phe)-imidazoG37] synthetase (radical SAM superfamily)